MDIKTSDVFITYSGGGFAGIFHYTLHIKDEEIDMGRHFENNQDIHRQALDIIKVKYPDMSITKIEFRMGSFYL